MLEKTANQFSLFTKNLINTISSILKIVIRSRFNVQLPSKTNDRCSILGNGPSLQFSLENNLEFIQCTELICVNNFAHSPYFIKLTPKNYALLDPYFFLFDGNEYNREDVSQTMKAFAEVNWDMYLFMPQHARKSNFLNQLIKSNTFLHPVYFNYTVTRGFEKIIHWLFKQNLGMPQCQNILAASICLSINRGFKEIYLFGADHSWHEQLQLTDQNDLTIKDLHFYDANPNHMPTHKLVDVKSKKKTTMSFQFAALSKAFLSYEILERYARQLGVKVFNASAKSYIDAFERIRLS
ncbi:hypothetical protein C3K47_01050 [Solitalea longa]|uniref:DUF115 domain-containing protein n=1 Tax=Solitalea longa TaxID=2079460 RepID=A0A2S5A9C7_9SPHI|nr:hypothetical protein [Solitalea longa]POY39114.1 hypothetical protein C3K47_01050 [Solitalea longa]